MDRTEVHQAVIQLKHEHFFAIATSIDRRVPSRVHLNHRVSKSVFVTIKLLRVVKRPSFLSLQIFLLFGHFAFWWVQTIDVVTLVRGFHPSKNKFYDFFFFFFSDKKEGRFATRSILTVTKTPFETRWLRKTRNWAVNAYGHWFIGWKPMYMITARIGITLWFPIEKCVLFYIRMFFISWRRANSSLSIFSSFFSDKFWVLGDLRHLARIIEATLA